MKTNQKAFIIVDVQKAFEHEKWGERNNLEAEENISRLLTFWREKGWKVIHIQHTSTNRTLYFIRQMKGTFSKIWLTR